MLRFQKGNIFNQKVEALVNPVNCVGISSKGLALEFKKRYLNNFIAYKKYCLNNGLFLGNLFLYNIGDNKTIINFPTKIHWRDKSSLESIDSGLKTLALETKRLGITSMAIPKLGCGLGGLYWADVKILFKLNLTDLDCDVVVVE